MRIWETMKSPMYNTVTYWLKCKREPQWKFSLSNESIEMIVIHLNLHIHVNTHWLASIDRMLYIQFTSILWDKADVKLYHSHHLMRVQHDNLWDIFLYCSYLNKYSFQFWATYQYIYNKTRRRIPTIIKLQIYCSVFNRAVISFTKFILIFIFPR